MSKADFITELDKYLPEGTSESVVDLIYEKNVQLVITRQRNSKLGDYRPAFGRKGHQISINHNLNPYSFLITLIHEIAHFYVWIKHRNEVKPHGIEWKNQFRELMIPFLQERVFPENLEKVLANHLKNPKASSVADPILRKELIKFDAKQVTLLDEIPHKSIFLFNGNRVFRKEEKLRTRYRCFDMVHKKYYLINKSAEVELINRDFIKD